MATALNCDARPRLAHRQRPLQMPSTRSNGASRRWHRRAADAHAGGARRRRCFFVLLCCFCLPATFGFSAGSGTLPFESFGTSLSRSKNSRCTTMPRGSSGRDRLERRDGRAHIAPWKSSPLGRSGGARNGVTTPASPSSSTSLSATASQGGVMAAATAFISGGPTLSVARTFLGVLLARRVSESGLRKGSLSPSGAAAAFAVASLAAATSTRNAATLLAFYWTGSKLTRVGSKLKGTLLEEEGGKEEDDRQRDGNHEGSCGGGTGRGARQVLACSLIAVACAVVRRVFVGPDGPLVGSSAVSLLGDRLTLAYVAFFACCAGDTWASELGILSRSRPRLIIRPWKAVPPGTNGAVSWVGLGASAAGGIVMGCVHALLVPGGIASFFSSPSLSSPSILGREISTLALVGFVAGLVGSLLDSVLGATVQPTYYDSSEKRIVKQPGPNAECIGGLAFLSNEMVNVVSSAIAALVAALMARPLFVWMGI